MTVLRNNFDAGPHGTGITVANSGSVPGNDAFDATSAQGSGRTLQYNGDSARPTAEFVGQFATGATAVTSAVQWSLAMGTQTQIWFREYVRWEAFPPGPAGAVIFACHNDVVFNAVIGVDSTAQHKLYVSNGAETQQTPFTNSMQLSHWYRLEARFQFSTTTGNWEARLYEEADSDTPTESQSGSNWNLGAASATTYIFGYPLAAANQPDVRLSGLSISNEGWLGPAPFRAGKGVPGILSNSIAPHVG